MTSYSLKEKSRVSLCILFIITLTCFAYYPSLDNDFLYWDDQFYLTSNPDLINPSSESLKTILRRIVSLNYHPVTMLSFWLNAKLSGVSTAQPFILTNVIIHVLNSVLVFLLILRVAESKLLVAFTTSLVFAIHPMHIESVAWISERKDLLYTFFFLASLISYVSYTQLLKTRWWLVSLIFFVFSCLSKASAVSLVPCLFLYDYLVKRNFLSVKMYVEKVPFLFVALLIGLVALNVQAGEDFYGHLELGEKTQAYNKMLSLQERISNALGSNFYYLTKFVFPNKHSAFHPYSLVSNFNSFQIFLITSIVVILGIWALITKRRIIVFGLGFYGLTIFLLLQFIPVGAAIVAERYSYLAYVGLAYLLGQVLQFFHARRLTLVPLVFLPIIALCCTYNTRQQVDKWQNHTTLFQQAMEQYPNDPFIRTTLASGYWTEGKLDSAIYHVTYAINKLDDFSSRSMELLANCYAESGNTEQANVYFNEAVALDSSNVSARYHRGLNLLALDPRAAIDDFNFCEQSGNAYVYPLIYGPRGRAYGLVSEFEKAIENLSKAIELAPDYTEMYLDRAVTYEKIGKINAAIEDYRKALKIDEQNQFAITRLAQLTDLN